MKIIFLLACLLLLFGFNTFAQTENSLQEEQGSSAEKVSVQTITLARDDGKGKPGEETDVFGTRDIPIYCLVQLDSVKPATVKMNLVVVNVPGLKSETKLFTVSYTTNGNQSRVRFTGKPEGIWTAGKYRIDIFIDNQTAGSREFEIQKSAQEIQKEKDSPQTPPKTLQKSKNVKRLRKS